MSDLKYKMYTHDDLISELNGRDDEIKKLNDLVESLKQNTKDLMQEYHKVIESKNETIATNQQERNTALHNAEIEIERCRSRLKDSQSAYEELEHSHDKKVSKLLEYEDAINKQKKEIYALRTQVDSLKQQEHLYVGEIKQHSYKIENLQKEISMYIDRLRQLNNAMHIQGMMGNWNYDPYMFGMFNGIAFAQAVMSGIEPQYKNRPEKFIRE